VHQSSHNRTDKTATEQSSRRVFIFSGGDSNRKTTAVAEQARRARAPMRLRSKVIRSTPHAVIVVSFSLLWVAAAARIKAQTSRRRRVSLWVTYVYSSCRAVGRPCVLPTASHRSQTVVSIIPSLYHIIKDKYPWQITSNGRSPADAASMYGCHHYEPITDGTL